MTRIIIKRLKHKVTQKINQLLRDNKKFFSDGKLDDYNNNCNQLKGIDFVMGRIEKEIEDTPGNK